VHVDEHVCRTALQARERGVGLGEGRARGVDEDRAREIDHAERHAVALGHRDAAPGARDGEVRRAHDPLVAVEEGIDRGVTEGVVAERQHVHAEIEELARGALGDADAPGRVLAVGDDEVGREALA